jgi:hypothetical protein
MLRATTMLTANGYALNPAPEAFSSLEPSNDILQDASALRETMEREGYLFFRQLLPREDVMAARREILLKYATIGEIDPQKPLMDAIWNPDSAVAEVNLRAFSESVRSGLAYEKVVLHPELLGLYQRLLGSTPRAYDMRWPRFARPGEGCGFHYDGPYMNHGTDRLYSSWIPLGDISQEEGGLIILERSEVQLRKLRAYADSDADADGLEWIGRDPERLRERFGGRWLGADYRAGDVLCFTMQTLHGALDNNSKEDRCRLSSDTRYQPADEPFDERWNGEVIAAHGPGKVFYPGLGSWNNKEFLDEWKPVDARGRLKINDS